MPINYGTNDVSSSGNINSSGTITSTSGNFGSLTVNGTGNFTQNLLVNGTGVSLSGHKHVSYIEIQEALLEDPPSALADIGAAPLSHTHISADITDFNSSVSGLVSGIYQPLLNNPVTGTGTSGYLSRFTSSNTIDNSIIYESGGNIGIGTTTPSGKLHIGSGDLHFDSSYGLRWAGGSRLYEQTNALGGVERMLYMPNGDRFEVLSENGVEILMGVHGANSLLANSNRFRRAVGIGANYGSSGTLPFNGLAVQGNVGIGVQSPGAPLHVIGSGIYSTSDSSSIITIDPSGRSIDVNPSAFSDIILKANGQNIFRGIDNWTGTWNDAVSTTYFQVGRSTGNTIFTSFVGNPFNRLAYSASKILFTNDTSNLLTPSGYFTINSNINGGSVGTSGLVIDTTHSSASANGQSHGALVVTPLFNTVGSNLNNIYGAYIAPRHSGVYTTTNSYALYVNATNNITGTVTNNYAAVFDGGNVGIRTTAPTAQLHVIGSGIFASGITSTIGYLTSLNIGNSVLGASNALAVNGSITTQGQSVTAASFNIYGSTLNSLSLVGSALRLSTNDISVPHIFVHFTGATPIERMRITGSGIGIGITTPSGQLHVVGSGIFSSGLHIISEDIKFTNVNSRLSWDNGSEYIARAPGTDGIVIATQAVTKVMVTSAGNVGINTTNPSQSLEVSGNIAQTWTNNDYRSATVFNNDWRMGINYGTASRTLNLFSTSNDTNGHIIFSTRIGSGTSATDYGSERMRITGSGRVGIGHNSPSGGLHIKNDGGSWSSFNYSPSIVIDGSRNNGIGFLDSTSSNPMAIVNNGGRLVFASMPPLGSSGTGIPPSPHFTITNTGTVVVGSTALAEASGKFGVINGSSFVYACDSIYETLSIGPRKANDGFSTVVIYPTGNKNTGGLKYWNNTYGHANNTIGYNDGTTTNTLLTTTVEGNFGIGVSPSYKLHVNGTGNFTTVLQNGNRVKDLTLAYFTPLNNQPPASAFATLDTRNSIAILDFDDTTSESGVFVGILPENAALSSGLLVRIHWMATTATSGICRWGVQFEKMTTDLDIDSFDTTIAESGSVTNATNGIPTITEIPCTGLDSLAGGDLFTILVYRDSNDTVNDTMVGDAELIAIELRSII